MKKHLKWIIPTVSIILILSIGFGVWFNHIPTKVGWTLSEFVHNEGIQGTADYSDYIFVGYIEEIHDYYTERHKRDFPDKFRETGSPYTEFVVKVIKCIDGNIKEGETISVYKADGVVRNRMYIQWEDGDLIPKAGMYCTFSCVAQIDGITFIMGGASGILELEQGITEKNYTDSKIYNEFVTAVEKNSNSYFGFVAPTEHYLSVYDPDFSPAANEKLSEIYSEKESERESLRQWRSEQNTEEST